MDLPPELLEHAQKQYRLDEEGNGPIGNILIPMGIAFLIEAGIAHYFGFFTWLARTFNM